MPWFNKQPRLTQCYVYVVSQLNDIGIFPAGNVIKAWLRQEMLDQEFEPTTAEIATLLTGLIQEKAITQRDVNKLMERASAKKL
jgi:hypothetical protein